MFNFDVTKNAPRKVSFGQNTISRSVHRKAIRLECGPNDCTSAIDSEIHYDVLEFISIASLMSFVFLLFPERQPNNIIYESSEDFCLITSEYGSNT